MEKSEYIFIFILALGIAFIIGISIVGIVDRKISNIAINIPKINVPPTNVTVKLGEKCSCEEPLNVKYYNTYDNNQTVKPSTIEAFDNTASTSAPILLESACKSKKKRKKTTNKDCLAIGSMVPKNKMGIIDVQLDCIKQNNLTAEKYYNKIFKYPHVPLPSEKDRWIPADFVNTNYYANAKVWYKVNNGKHPNKSVPYPSNYVFSR
jgi:hypothetical protein